MNEQQLTTMMRELHDEGTQQHTPFPADRMPRHRVPVRAAVVGTVTVAAVVIAAVTLTHTGSDTERLVPVEASPAPPSPTATPHAAASILPPIANSPIPGTVPTGISGDGPQITSIRWKNVNSWTGRLNATTYLSVYAGGTPIDPTLQHSEGTAAGVLVITPADLDKFDHNQVTLGEMGTIYQPAGDPRGQLKVLSVDGTLLTLQLVGTGQTYVFNTVTDSFE
jgi:hypothetical protein